jgi:adenylate kinase family enzyme
VKDGTLYPRNTALAVLVLGHPGAGKTNLCMEFPDPWYLDADLNLRNAIERHPGKHFTWDNPEVDDKGQLVPEEQRWARCEVLIKAAGANPQVGTIVVDGLGRIADYLKAYLVHTGGQAEKSLMVGGMKVMTMSLWGPFSDLMKRFVFLCRSYGKPFVMTSHIGVDENELTTIKEQKVLLQGALKSDFPKLFTDAWMANAVPNSAEPYKKSNGVRYYVRTAPDVRIMLKQSCGLPAEFEHDAPEFRKLIASLVVPATVAPTATPPTPLPPPGAPPAVRG